MTDIFDVPGSAAPDSAVADATTTRLDFERLDVYRVAVEFHALTAAIRLPPGRRELRDQLDRAALDGECPSRSPVNVVYHTWNQRRAATRACDVPRDGDL